MRDLLLTCCQRRVNGETNMDPLSDAMGHNSYVESPEFNLLEMEDFIPKRALGSGTCSEVCLLVRKSDGKKFAGKFLKHLTDARAFINEATIMKDRAAGCSSIVRLVGIIMNPRCLVLPYYENGSLDAALREDNEKVENGSETEFPFLRRLGYILDVCKAVNYLHKHNVCHRDIAMRNLLLSDDKEHVLLADFSLSRMVTDPLQRQKTFTTTVPITSAPETFVQGNGLSYSLKSDIWSLGVAMYEIIEKNTLIIRSGEKLPIRFSKAFLPPSKVFNRTWDLLTLIFRCWCKNQEQRPQIWEVQARIEALLENPLDIRKEHEGYINWIVPGGTSTEDSSEDSSVNPRQRGIRSDSTSSSGSFVLYSSDSSKNARKDSYSSESPSHTHTRPSHLRILDAEERDKSRWKMSKSLDDKKRVPPQIIRPVNATRFNFNSLIPNKFNLNSLTPSGFSNKNSPSGRKADGHLMKYRKRQHSVSSLVSVSMTSFGEISPSHSARVEYCSPLSMSSDVTNIADCGDRHFFESRANDLISLREVDISESPRTPEIRPARGRYLSLSSSR